MTRETYYSRTLGFAYHLISEQLLSAFPDALESQAAAPIVDNTLLPDFQKQRQSSVIDTEVGYAMYTLGYRPCISRRNVSCARGINSVENPLNWTNSSVVVGPGRSVRSWINRVSREARGFVTDLPGNLRMITRWTELLNGLFVQRSIELSRGTLTSTI